MRNSCFLSQIGKLSSARAWPVNRLGGLALVWLVLCLLLQPACAAAPQIPWKTLFPSANRIDDFAGTPPAAAIYRNDTVIGYLLRTKQIAPIPAYSGKPMDMLVGIDLEGNIVGIKVIEHHEPILLVAYVHDMGRAPAWDKPGDEDYVVADQAWYVIGHDMSGAMGPTLASFKEEAAARAFMQQHGGRLLRHEEINLSVLAELMQGHSH